MLGEWGRAGPPVLQSALFLSPRHSARSHRMIVGAAQRAVISGPCSFAA